MWLNPFVLLPKLAFSLNSSSPFPVLIFLVYLERTILSSLNLHFARISKPRYFFCFCKMNSLFPLSMLLDHLCSCSNLNLSCLNTNLQIVLNNPGEASQESHTWHQFCLSPLVTRLSAWFTVRHHGFFPTMAVIFWQFTGKQWPALHPVLSPPLLLLTNKLKVHRRTSYDYV